MIKVLYTIKRKQNELEIASSSIFAPMIVSHEERITLLTLESDFKVMVTMFGGKEVILFVFSLFTKYYYKDL